VRIAAAVVADSGVPPELVSQESTPDHVRVVHLVVVADPAADHAPARLHGGVSAEAANLWGLTSHWGAGPEVLGGESGGGSRA